MRDVTIAPSLAADMIGYLRARGHDADAVCARAGIDPARLGSSERRLGGSTMAIVWREALAVSGDPDLGLHTATASTPGVLDIVGYVMLSSRTADEALRRGARLMRLLNDGLAIELTRERAGTRCRLVVLPHYVSFPQEAPRQIVETTLAGLVHQIRLLTEQRVVPVSVSMRHPQPDHGAREHARVFGVIPLFGAAHDEVVLAHRDLEVPLRSANPQLLAAFEAHAEAALDALKAGETVAGRVSAEVLIRLKGEVPAIDVVASALAMSPRKLQRELAAEGTTFQAVLDAVRRELAVRHLADPQATVAKVAWLVGFSEPSAFHRAFRRWTGRSPRAAA